MSLARTARWPTGRSTRRSVWRSRTRAPPCTSPGAALYTEDLVGRHKDVLHAWPLQAPHAHARVTNLRVDARVRGPRRGQGADRRGRAGGERRGGEARRAAVSRAR